jgi:hypothetical protein
LDKNNERPDWMTNLKHTDTAIPSLQKKLYAMHFHIVKMYKDKEVTNVKNFFVNVWRKSIFDIYVTEYGTA